MPSPQHAHSAQTRSAQTRSAQTRSTPFQRVRPGLTLLAAATAGVGLLAVRDPHRHGSYGFCPLLALTGLYCPFCGGLRSVNDVTHGKLADAVSSNALLVLGAPAAAVVVALALWRLWHGAPPPAAPRWLRWTLLTVVVAFGVARNLPWGAALAP